MSTPRFKPRPIWALVFGLCLGSTAFANSDPLLNKSAKTTTVTMPEATSSIKAQTDGKYTGQKISLENFQNTEVRQLLQVLAETASLNFVISDTVTGTMTLNLKDTAWDQVMDIILSANGLGYQRFGDVYLIAPVDELTSHEVQKLAAQQKLKQLAPLKSEILHLKYSNAEAVAHLLKDNVNNLLSPRGQVGVDKRTNSLWLRDIPENLAEVKHYIKILDIPAKQVLIEAKIVVVDKSFALNIGARFGIHSQNLKGRLASDLDKNTDLDKNLFFNLPAQGTRPGSIALSMLSLGSHGVLNLELSALEEIGKSKTIASPRLITSNQETAYIKQGEEIPFQQSTSSGATSVEFKEAVLSLEITPQITPDDNIILRLKVNQDTRGEQIKISKVDNSPVLPPAIDTQSIDSVVFLKNGETLIVGGIYQTVKSEVITRVPILGKIPVIGWLFRNTAKIDNERELLVFITPRIINRSSDSRAIRHRNPYDRVSFES